MLDMMLNIQHRLNPLHLYCRLLERELNKRFSPSICRYYMPLSFAQEGEPGIIQEFMGGAAAQLRLATIGLRKGAEVEVITNSGQGQVVVAVNGTRLALGRGIAKKIMVKPNGIRKG